MSTRRAQADPNPRKTASIQPPCISIPNKDTPQPSIGTPSSTTTATQVNTMAANPPLAATPGSSSLIPTRVDNLAIEECDLNHEVMILYRTYLLTIFFVNFF